MDFVGVDGPAVSLAVTFRGYLGACVWSRDHVDRVFMVTLKVLEEFGIRHVWACFFGSEGPTPRRPYGAGAGADDYVAEASVAAGGDQRDRFAGRDFRLTDVSGNVVQGIVA